MTEIQDDVLPDKFLVDLGMRVKKARRARKLSRRQIAEISSVSQRFLSQFESGEGNISIKRFRSICIALDVPMEIMLREESVDSQRAELSAALDSASPAQLGMIHEVLDLHRPSTPPSTKIALTGLRGAGKSTLAPLLAEALGYRLFELNQEVRQAAGLELDEVFALYGPEGYRRLERQALENIATSEDEVVITTGGGIVSDITTYRYLLSQFLTVWISTSAEEHMRRVVAQGDQRPIGNSDTPLQALNAILVDRKPLYAMAPLALDTTGQDISACIETLVTAIQQYR